MTAVKWPEIQHPVPAKKAHVRDIHGDKVNDDYYWMIDFFKKGADSNEVVQYLEAENKYLDDMMVDTKGLQETLFKEMRGGLRKKIRWYRILRTVISIIAAPKPASSITNCAAKRQFICCRRNTAGCRRHG
nr:hypothetical protein [Niabella hibiscisoli]